MKLFDLEPQKPQINLTPLIDILFILIIFFVVTSKISNDHGMALQLPQSAEGDKANPALLTLQVTASQELLLNDQKLLWDELEAELAGQLSQYPEKTILFNVDQKVPHGQVLRSMDLAKQAGFHKIIFGTEKTVSKGKP